MPKETFNKISTDKKIKLITSSLKEFVESSYDKISISSLTHTMKILRTDFYYYFTDKEDIYNELFNYYYLKLQEIKKDPSFDECLNIVLNEIINFCEKAKNRSKVIELTDNYHPSFVKKIVEKAQTIFNISLPNGKSKIDITMKIYRLMTVANLYAKSELTRASAVALLNE